MLRSFEWGTHGFTSTREATYATQRWIEPICSLRGSEAKVHIARDPSDVYASTIETGYPGPCTFINRIPCGKCWLRQALSLPGALRSARS